MPGEIIDRPNPEPLPSQVPKEVSSLAVKLEGAELDPETSDALLKYRRVANYIAAGLWIV